MVQYHIQVKNKAGETLGEFDKWSNLVFEKRLNNVGQCSFQVPASDTKLLDMAALRNHEVYVYRGNTLVWAGEMANHDGVLQLDSPNHITIIAYDFLELLNARLTDPSVRYDQIDAGAIAWDLIDTSQQQTDGDFGITEGVIEETVLRDRTYEEKNIMEALIQLSEVQNGFDFEVTDDKVFNVFAHKGADLSQSVTLEWRTNIKSARIGRDFTNPCNEARVLGSGFGASQIKVTVTDTDSRAAMKLRQQRVSYTDVSQEDTLTDKGTAVVNQYKVPVEQLQLVQLPGTKPTFGSLKPGDTIRVKIREGFWNINNRYRIYGYKVNVGDMMQELIEYFVSLQ